MTAVLPSTDELDDLVRRVAGVQMLYPARRGALAVAAAALQQVRPAVPGPAVVVEANGKSVRVTARIGISSDASSVDVCSRVHEALAAHLAPGADSTRLYIDVIVARIG